MASVASFNDAAPAAKPTQEQLVNAEIEACVASLGYFDGGKYHREKDTLGELVIPTPVTLSS